MFFFHFWTSREKIWAFCPKSSPRLSKQRSTCPEGKLVFSSIFLLNIFWDWSKEKWLYSKNISTKLSKLHSQWLHDLFVEKIYSEIFFFVFVLISGPWAQENQHFVGKIPGRLSMLPFTYSKGSFDDFFPKELFCVFFFDIEQKVSVYWQNFSGTVVKTSFWVCTGWFWR